MVDGVEYRSNASGIVEIPLQSIPPRLPISLVEGERQLDFIVDTPGCGAGPVLHVALHVLEKNATCTAGELVIGG